MSEDEEYGADVKVLLQRIARELTTLRTLGSQVINKIIEAESEVPEKVRRFMTYMHDLHDITYMYESKGVPIPDWILREAERCDDRYRQLLKELYAGGGVFDKVRREMAEDPENRWDHTRLLFPPKEKT